MIQNKCNVNITQTIIRNELPTTKLKIYKINSRAITEKTFIRVNRHAGNAAFVAILVCTKIPNNIISMLKIEVLGWPWLKVAK